MNYRILFFIPFLTSTLACNGSEWLYHKAVQYQENHDPSMVWLNTGEKVEVRHSNITRKEVDTWKKGKQLFIAYRPETGVVLEDPKTRKTIPILRGLKKHPIDDLMEKRYKTASSTVACVACYVGIRKLWDQELNRVYREVLTDEWDRKLKADERQVLVEAQRKWIQFRDAQIKAIGTHYGRRDGTMWRIVAARQVLDLTKQQALRLRSMLGY